MESDLTTFVFSAVAWGKFAGQGDFPDFYGKCTTSPFSVVRCALGLWEVGSGQGKWEGFQDPFFQLWRAGLPPWVWVLSWVRVWLPWVGPHVSSDVEPVTIVNPDQTCLRSWDNTGFVLTHLTEDPDRLQVRYEDSAGEDEEDLGRPVWYSTFLTLYLCYIIYLSRYFSVQSLFHTLHEWTKWTVS